MEKDAPDGDTAEQLVQLLIVTDGELKVTGNDTALLVVTGGVTGQLEDLGSEVLEDGSEVDWRGAKRRCNLPSAIAPMPRQTRQDRGTHQGHQH